MSSAESAGSVNISALASSGLQPLVNDSVLFANGDIRRIITIEDDVITCGEVVASVKGNTGETGKPGAPGERGEDGISPTFDFSNGILTITSA